jgi:phenylacetate-CoA ligase
MTSVAKETAARTDVPVELRAPGVGEHPFVLLGTSPGFRPGAPSIMNWRKPLIRSLSRLLRPGVLRELDLIQSIEKSSPAAIKHVQRERLQRLLHHAWNTTEYYREVLEQCGAVTAGVVNLDRFEDIPFLTKDIIRAQGSRLRAISMPEGRRPYANQSGGSTGVPVQIWQDNGYWDATIATRTYQFSMTGKDLGEREMKIWGSDRDLFHGTIGLKAKIENWIYNRKFEQCFYLPEEQILRIIQDINNWRPKMLWCYRDGIDAIARYINRHRLTVHRPCAIILGAATVYPFIVQEIERAFGCPALSAYGSREIGAAACECLSRQGQHIATQAHVVETIGTDERPVMEQTGELSITPLLNFAMPMIRYRIGDQGRLTEQLCDCGRKFPLLESISGRTVEVLENSKREHVDPSYFIHLLGVTFNNGNLRKFQVVQEEDLSLTINFVPEANLEAEQVFSNIDEIRDKIGLVMGPNCGVNFCRVDDIALSASGKHPYVVRRRPSSVRA